MPDVDPFREMAAAYHTQGWEPLPLPYRAKFPPPKGYTGKRKSKTVTAEVLDRWLAEDGPHNVALHLPDGVIGIDVDAYADKAGLDTLGEWERNYGELPPAAVCTSRPRGEGSGIRLYRVPTGLQWAERLGPGVEVIQAGHRYIVAPPSIHPDTGAAYEWRAPLHVPMFAPPGELPELPAAWVEALQRGAQQAATAAGSVTGASVDAWLRKLAHGAMCTRVEATLSERLGRLGANGSRHDEMTRAVFELVALGAEGHAGVYTALRQYKSRFARAVKDDRTGGPAEAAREYVSALMGAVAQRADVEPADSCDCEPGVPAALEGWALFPKGVLSSPMATPGAIWGDGDAIGWGQGQSLLLFGPTGVGKSTLALQLVWARLGLRDEVLGLPVLDDGGRVLYLAADRPSQLTAAMTRLVGDVDPSCDRLVITNGPPPVDITRDREALLAAAKAVGATTVVVDSIKDMMSSPSDEEAAGGYNHARQALLRNGIEVLELHHARKATADNKVPDKLADVYGSTWLTAGAGSVIGLGGEPGAGDVVLRHLKLVRDPLPISDARIDYKTGAVMVVGYRSTEARPTMREALLGAGPDGITAHEVSELTGASEASIRALAGRMVESGELESMAPVGRRSRWRPVGADLFGGD